MIISTIKNYSPQSIHEIVYPNNEVKEMVFAYASGALETPLLLYGTSGTGKTLIQRLLPNAIEKKELQIEKIKCNIIEKTGKKNGKKTFYGDLPESINKWLTLFYLNIDDKVPEIEKPFLQEENKTHFLFSQVHFEVYKKGLHLYR